MNEVVSFGLKIKVLWCFFVTVMNTVEGQGFFCGSPPRVSNAQARYKSSRSGDIVTYECYHGYTLFGAAQRTCKENGRWDGVAPYCVRTCRLPDIPSSMYIAKPTKYNRTYLTGEVITLACKKGFEEQVGGNPVRVCIYGRWTQFPFQCKETTTCGFGSVASRLRIVGGVQSGRGRWPWQIGVYGINKGVMVFLCGGALISRRWLLTAAHCFYRNSVFHGNASRYVIKAGDYDREANETSEQEMVPERIFVHQKYKHESSVDADIALVKLPTKVKLNRFVRTVCLPENYEGDLAIPGTKGVVAGWGVTRALRHGEYVKPDDTSNVLRHAFFTIQENNICRKKSSILYNSTLAFCAGDRKGVKDSCRGDSGGAFVREVKRRRNLHWVAVGIVSWGEGCAQTENYGYYTRLYPFIDWIKKTKNKPIDCGVLMTPTNAKKILETHTRVGGVVVFGCKDESYEIHGAGTRWCLHTGLWSGIATTCKKRGCVRLLRDLQNNPPNDHTVIAINLKLAKARYLCLGEFRLFGRKIRSCVNGKWREKEPKCLGPCGRPGYVPHAYYCGSFFRYKDVLTYGCKKGYKLRGPKKRKCLKDGKWSKPPTCSEDVDTTCPILSKKRFDRGLEHNFSKCTPYGIELNTEDALDLVFLIDGSCSKIDEEGFEWGLDFSTELVRTIGLSQREHSLRVALVMSQSKVNIEFNLGDAEANSIRNTICAISRIRRMGGPAHWSRAFRMVREVVAPFARGQSKRVMIVITNGRSTSPSSPEIREAWLLRIKERFQIFVVGVGEGKWNEHWFSELSSSSIAFHHVIFLRHKKAIKGAIKRVVSMCE